MNGYQIQKPCTKAKAKGDLYSVRISFLFFVKYEDFKTL